MFLFTKLCLNVVHWLQVSYSTCFFSNGNASKNWTGSSLLDIGDVTGTSTLNVTTLTLLWFYPVFFFWVFFTSFRWLSYSRVWRSASFLRYPWHFSIFDVVLTILWSPLELSSLILPDFFRAFMDRSGSPTTNAITVIILFHRSFSFPAWSKYYQIIARGLFTPALECGFSVESDREQSYSGLLDSLQYSSRSQQCSSLNRHNISSDY